LGDVNHLEKKNEPFVRCRAPPAVGQSIGEDSGLRKGRSILVGHKDKIRGQAIVREKGGRQTERKLSYVTVLKPEAPPLKRFPSLRREGGGENRKRWCRSSSLKRISLLAYVRLRRIDPDRGEKHKEDYIASKEGSW